MTKIIFPHLELGDNIICNGLIRRLVSPSEEYILITKPQIKDSIFFMYRDLINVQHWIGWYPDAVRMIKGLRIPRENLLLIGDAGRGDVPTGLKFDAWFYWQHKLDFSHSFDDFHVPRDPARELSLAGRLVGTSDRYILIHEDERFRINREYVDFHPGIKVINISPSQTKNAFDWCTLIENAEEIHFIESSMMFLAERLLYRRVTRPRLILHRYARKYPASNSPTLISDWTILNV